jgi:DNA modification methylase
MEYQYILHQSQEAKKDYREYKGKRVRVDEGVFWTQKQRQGHSLHYIVPYQACFAPQIPQFFIRKFSKPGKVVLDPFAGRGTTIFEANQLGRVGVGLDVSPLAITLSKLKLHQVSFDNVKKRLEQIDLSEKILKGYENFKDIYHPQTYSEIMNFKRQLRNTPVDNFIKGIILGRLHGHSSSFFSIWTFNVISLSKERIINQSKSRGLKPTYRDTKESILKKAKTVLRDQIRIHPASKVYEQSILNMSEVIKPHSVDLIVTSPPFLDVINYIDDNWLRFWFLGYDREKLRKLLVQTSNILEYKEFIRSAMSQMNKALKPNKYCIIEVGDVKSGKINLDEIIVELAEETGFSVERVLINYITAPKISRAFSRKKPGEGTKTNRCVIMRKLSD